MNRLFNEQQRRNADSRGSWESYSQHRQQVTDLIIQAGQTDARRLCILGAGNCNDVDLATLCDHFSAISLIDIDEKSVALGVAAQGLAAHMEPAEAVGSQEILSSAVVSPTAASQGLPEQASIKICRAVDLSGCSRILDRWCKEETPAESELEDCLSAIDSFNAPLELHGFDVVASLCLLTQLLDSVAISLDASHPRFVELLTRIRLRHARMLFELLQPGGTALLITDFVSSLTYPAIAQARAHELPDLAARLIHAGNFFTGANPAALVSMFQVDEVLARQTNSLKVTRPWLWDFGPRVYVVCGIVVCKVS